VGLLIFVAADRLPLVENMPSSGPTSVSTKGTKDAGPPKAGPVENVRQIPEQGYVISILSTRIGAALILIFLAKILVNLYGYNARLASFNDSRADAIQLLGNKAEDLKVLVPLVAAERVMFAETPKVPLVEEIASAALKKKQE
jgi:hypothetical protein